ncbi:hypothetical protein N7540_002216 [Penicillium herquei]|nr:hypothetical protein N7540_002216 [Penicillium herquei]
MHHRDCDCGRCNPPGYFKLLAESEDLKDLKVFENRRGVFEIKQQHEEAALRRILSTGHNVLYLREEPQYSRPITPEEEVTAILFDVLNRFEEGGECFTVQEVQIAAAELIHTKQQNCIPQYRLLLLVMGACVNFSDLEDVSSECRQLLKKRAKFQGLASQGAQELLDDLDPAYKLWQDRVKENPNGWLFHFEKNGTATLIVSSEDHHARASPRTSMDIVDMPDCDVRDIMASNDAVEKRNYPTVFNARGGKYQGRVRPPYWPVALASDENGYRYLSDEVLEDILPGWRSIIDADKKYLIHYTRKWDKLYRAWRHGDDYDNEDKAIKVDKSSKNNTPKRSTRLGSSQRDPTTSSRSGSPFPSGRSELTTASSGSSLLSSGETRSSGADEGGHHQFKELKSLLEGMRQDMEELETRQRAAFTEFTKDISENISKQLDSIEKKMRGLKMVLGGSQGLWSI